LEIPRQLQTVKLTGAVQNPVAISFKTGQRLHDYISSAGGFTDEADKRRAYVKYANGVSVQIKQFLIFKKYPKIKPGSEIVVPEFPKDRKKGLSTGEAIGLTTSLASLSLTLITLINNLTK
jgi:protein involved in polysaccharide export with SLBB domain